MPLSSSQVIVHIKYVIIALLPVLQLSSSTRYNEYDVGKVNDTVSYLFISVLRDILQSYAIRESWLSDSRTRELVTIEADGTFWNSPLPDCGIDHLEMSPTDIRLQDNRVFVLGKDLNSQEKVFQIVDVPDLFSDNTSEICIPVADAYFGKQNTYVYRVENETVLERWLVTPDGNLTDSEEIAITQLVSFLCSVGNNSHF